MLEVERIKNSKKIVDFHDLVLFDSGTVNRIEERGKVIYSIVQGTERLVIVINGTRNTTFFLCVIHKASIKSAAVKF